MSSAKELKDIPFFYILSMGRSGSTLLEFLLDAHPNVNIPLESRFIIHLYYKYSSRTNWKIDDKKNFISDLYKDKKLISFWKIDKRQLENDILNTASTVTFFELCRIITANYISFYPKEKIRIQGSKNPIYGLWSDILFQLNKKSKFIHLVRNPMGVVASHKKLGAKNLNYFAYRWNLMNTHIEKLKKQNPASFLTIKYEDLLNSPEKITQQVCQFLNLDYRPSQLKFNEAIKNYLSHLDSKKDASKKQMFNSNLKNLVNPIMNNFKDSWKTTLTRNEIQEISFITKESAGKHGYNIGETSNFKLKFIPISIKVKYNYFKLRLYYIFSLSIRLK
jgi:hypothetical protein